MARVMEESLILALNLIFISAWLSIISPVLDKLVLALKAVLAWNCSYSTPMVYGP